jgi:hypothetical protein
MPFLSIHPLEIKPRSAIKTISSSLDKLSKHPVNHISWPSFAYQPDVQFAIAYTNDSILFKFYVTENHIRHVNTKPNSPVYEDSCVEFFFSPDGNDDYYNFEFNPIGTCLAAYGNSRFNREYLDEKQISTIRTHSLIKNEENDQPVHWELAIAVPLSVLVHHPGIQLKGLSCKGNFYKCGDALPLPHYLSWNPVETNQPDFHTPNSFGMLYFADKTSA